jgi:hypothetical protein
MANKATGIKARRNKSWRGQDTSHTYVAKSSPDNRRGNYNTGDNTMKRTKGYDSLQGEGQEKRGRSKADAPRGKRKTSHTKKRTKKGAN